MNKTKHMIFLSLLVAGALALSVLENMIPLPFIAPGARLGLSNIVILSTLILFGFGDAMIVGLLKSVLLMLISGGVIAFFYSLAGSILSIIAMFLVKQYFGNLFSHIGISIIGAVAHNFAQMLVASFVVQNIRIFTYLPILILTGLFTGYFVGLSAIFIVKHMIKTIRYPFKEWKYE